MTTMTMEGADGELAAADDQRCSCATTRSARRESYVRAVGRLAGWCWKSPGEVGDEELRGSAFVSAQPEAAGAATTTIALCGIKFFFEQALKRDWTAMDIPRPRAEHKLPVVLSREEVWRILGEVRELRHRACRH